MTQKFVESLRSYSHSFSHSMHVILLLETCFFKSVDLCPWIESTQAYAWPQWFSNCKVTLFHWQLDRNWTDRSDSLRHFANSHSEKRILEPERLVVSSMRSIRSIRIRGGGVHVVINALVLRRYRVFWWRKLCLIEKKKKWYWINRNFRSI